MSAAAAAALARAETAGVRLRLDTAGRVRMEAAAPPPPEVVDGLRRHREAVALILSTRAVLAESAAAPQGCAGPSVGAEQAAPAWLAGLASAIGAALAEGAAREADPDGWLTLVRPDGRRLVVAPGAVAALAAAAGLLPGPLPPACETVEAARCARPPSWSDPGDPPAAGDRCGGCAGSRRWWREAMAPTGWRCLTCHPPLHLASDEWVEMTT